MKRRTRIFALAMAVVMAVSLCGCKKEEPVTAEGLLAGVPQMDPGKYQAMLLEIDMKTESEEGAASVSASGRVESAGDVLHLDGFKMSVGASGFSMEIAMDAWADASAGVAYSNVSAMGQSSGWTKSTSQSIPDLGSFDLSSMGEVKGPKLEDDGEGDYVVAWTADPEAIKDALAEMDNAELLDSVDAGLPEGQVDSASAAARFSREDKTLKAMDVALSMSDGTTLGMTVVFEAINGDAALAIPDEVVSTATEEDPFGDSGLDDGFQYDPNLEDGAELSRTEAGYYTDGDGRDDRLDPMAAALVAAGYSGDDVCVYHYDGYAEMDVSYYDEDGSGRVTIAHVSDEEAWYSPEEAFNDEYGFIEAYEGLSLAKGSQASGDASFTGVDADGDAKARIIRHGDGLYIESTGYLYDSTDGSAALAELEAFVDGVLSASEALQ